MNREKLEQNLILKLSFEFAFAIISFCELLEQKRKYIIARQLLKTGTAIGANAMEAQNAESRADFFHKFKLVAKEAEETEYWLLLCQYSETYPECIYLLERIASINSVVGKILSNVRKRKSFNPELL